MTDNFEFRSTINNSGLQQPITTINLSFGLSSLYTLWHEANRALDLHFDSFAFIYVYFRSELRSYLRYILITENLLHLLFSSSGFKYLRDNWVRKFKIKHKNFSIWLTYLWNKSEGFKSAVTIHSRYWFGLWQSIF